MSRHIRNLIVLLLTMPVFAQPFPADGSIRHRPNPIKDEYIVVLRDDVPFDRVPEVARALGEAHGAVVGKVFRYTIKAFGATMPESRARALARHPFVAYVEENAQVFLSTATTIPTDRDTRCLAGDPNGCSTPPVTTDNRLWHLDRLSQTWASRDKSHTSCYDGTGVTVYVVDTGVMGLHAEFLTASGSSRVQLGYDASGDSAYYPANNPCGGWAVMPEVNAPYRADEIGKYTGQLTFNSHGTAVASLVGGRFSGVAPNVTIVPVKVESCEENASRAILRNHHYEVGAVAFHKSNGTWFYAATKAGTTAINEPPLCNAANFPPNCFPYGTPGADATVEDGGVTWRSHSLPSMASSLKLMAAFEWIRQQPASKVVVTTSMFELANGGLTSLENVIKTLVEPTNGAIPIPVIASANNQGGDACATSPARISRDNPNPSLKSKVITAGGSMIVNIPDSIPATVIPKEEQANGGPKVGRTEPDYVPTKATRDARWVCADGDASNCDSTSLAGSNGGVCVTLFAPAKNVNVAFLRQSEVQGTVTKLGSTSYRDTLRSLDEEMTGVARKFGASGTSFSAPIVAGVVARLLQQNELLTVDGIHSALMANALHGVLIDELNYPLDPSSTITGTPNVLLNLADLSFNAGGQPADTTLQSGSSTTLTASVSGTGLSYQWFQVNSGFDLSVRRGATSSTPVGTNSPTLTVSGLSEPTGYWVRVKSQCTQIESDIAVVTPQNLAAPTGVSAYAVNGTATIHWNLVSGASGYIVERKVAGVDWATASTITNPSQNEVTDQPVTASGVVLYRVRATSGGGQSPPSFNSLAYAGTFLDDPLGVDPNGTTIKAQHIIELRRAVNGLREVVGGPQPYTGTDLDVNALRGQVVDDAHFTTLMSNLNAARTAPGVGLNSWGFSTPPVAGTPITRAQLDDLREGIK